MSPVQLVSLLLFNIGFTFGKPSNLSIKTDYCTIKCGSEEHTMCQFKRPSSSCEHFENLYDPRTATNSFFDINTRRNLIAGVDNFTWINGTEQKRSIPKAANMRMMVWDPELAMIAHQWLTQCITEHDKCRNTIKYEVGQSVGFYTGSQRPLYSFSLEYDLPSAIADWMHEIDDVTSEDIKSFNPQKVGCSEVTYTKNGQKMIAVACNYAPKGNKAGEPIYQTGEPCSACPKGTRCGLIGGAEFLCSKNINNPEDFELNEPVDNSAHNFNVFPTLPFFIAIKSNFS